MYETFYNFRIKPFMLTPDPRFFFNSAGHKRALAYLRYGVKQGEGFIIVTGDVGTGKTTLVGALFKSLETENVAAAQVVTTQLQADELLRVVAAEFDLPYERIGKAALLRKLEMFFRACVQEGKRVLLVVDEAQNLPKRAIEELRMLSNFTYRGRSLLQSFLLGQREFRTTMRSEGFEQLRQRVIAAYHLKPLNSEETRGYVEHRLLTAGWKGDPKITDEVFDGIYQFTDGVPRRVNTLCDRLMLFGALEELHHIDLEAFNAVASDIIEEQGGPVIDGPASRAPVVEPPPAPPPRARIEHAPERAPRSAPASDAGGASEGDRLAAVETNMAALTEAMREELSLLRKAFMDQAKRGEGKED